MRSTQFAANYNLSRGIDAVNLKYRLTSHFSAALKTLADLDGAGTDVGFAVLFEWWKFGAPAGIKLRTRIRLKSLSNFWRSFLTFHFDCRRTPFPGAWRDHRMLMDVRTIVLARSGLQTHLDDNLTAHEFG
jgi:hypothetical protein